MWRERKKIQNLNFSLIIWCDIGKYTVGIIVRRGEMDVVDGGWQNEEEEEDRGNVVKDERQMGW